MSKFEDLQKQARALAPGEKAALARPLIDDLDQSSDDGVEQLWLDEARRRYETYRRGDIPAVPGDQAIARARQRLR